MVEQMLTEYQELVNALMLLGWYRVGAGPHDEAGRTQWGFRQGHCTDSSPGETHWVPARNELGAMRAFLTTLRGSKAVAPHEGHDSQRRSPDEPGSGVEQEG
jgi:hypothetical protein